MYKTMAKPSHKPCVIDIWHIDPRIITQTDLVARFKGWLSAEESQRLNRLIQPSHQHAFLISHALKRGALARQLGCDPRELTFEVGSHGRPYVVRLKGDAPLEFNLSHTKGLAAVALSQTTYLGLDIESLDRNVPDNAFAKRFFTEPEYRDIARQSPQDQPKRLLTYWTLKEAYIKAEGLGISMGLDTFYFEVKGDQSRLNLYAGARTPRQPWQFKRFEPTVRHLMALAWAPITQHSDTGQNPSIRLASAEWMLA